MLQAAGLLSTNTLVVPQIALWSIYKALWLCSDFPLHFYLESHFKPEFDWLGIVGRLFMRPSVYLLDWYQTCDVAVTWDFSPIFSPSVFNVTTHCTMSKELPGSGFVEDWRRQKIPSPLEPELLKMFQVLSPAISCRQPASQYLWHLALGLMLENISLHPWSCLWRVGSPYLLGTPCEGYVSAVEEMDKPRNHAQHVGLAFPKSQKQFQLGSRREDTDREAQMAKGCKYCSRAE